MATEVGASRTSVVTGRGQRKNAHRGYTEARIGRKTRRAFRGTAAQDNRAAYGLERPAKIIHKSQSHDAYRPDRRARSSVLRPSAGSSRYCAARRKLVGANAPFARLLGRPDVMTATPAGDFTPPIGRVRSFWKGDQVLFGCRNRCVPAREKPFLAAYGRHRDRSERVNPSALGGYFPHVGAGGPRSRKKEETAGGKDRPPSGPYGAIHPGLLRADARPFSPALGHDEKRRPHPDEIQLATNGFREAGLEVRGRFSTHCRSDKVERPRGWPEPRPTGNKPGLSPRAMVFYCRD